MSVSALRLRRLLPAIMLVCSLGAGVLPQTAFAQCGCGSKGCRSGGSTAPARRSEPVAASDTPPPPPHGGQASASAAYWFEVVYLPQETRVYLYGRTKERLSARGVRGEVMMQVFGQPQQVRFPLEYAAGTGDAHDFLVARADVSRIRDRDMLVTFQLAELAAREEPAVRFAQVFALTRRGPEVVVAPVTAEDQAGIARQRTCPVMDTPLGEHGEVIKVLIDGRPLYLCCEGCVEKVRRDPLAYVAHLPEAAAARPNAQAAPAAPTITVSQVTAADSAAIQQQGKCPVMDTPLGAHGAPLKITIDGRPLFVCCQGCVRKVQQNPAYYLRKASGSQE